MRADMGIQAPAIATGGLSHVLVPVTGIFDRVDQLLTLRGLKLIAEITG
jgi:pantothenate kinase type III